MSEHPTLWKADELYPVKTTWRVPQTFPDLSSAKVISLDLETCDPGLKERGPGTRRGSFIAGIAIGTDDGFRGYYPVGHELGGNLDKKLVYRWAKEQLGRDNQIKIGANLLYDLEFLHFAGIPVKGQCYDVLQAEPLLDEHKKSYNLQSVAKSYLGESKVTDKMYAWAKQAYSGEPGANIWRCPVGLVGPYAEGDVDLPLRIFQKQRAALESENLWDLYQIESSLIPLLLQMRIRGVRVDLDKAEAIQIGMTRQMNMWQKELNKLAGFPMNVQSSDCLVRLFRKLGIYYPTTPAGNPSFTKDYMNSLPDTRIEISLILNIRKYFTILNTFIKGYVFDMSVDGRIYGSFHPMRSDDGGTVSGRFSSSNPNLQNIPARDKTIIDVMGKPMKLGKAIRSLFIPEEGCDWHKDDYSQVEFRILTHYGTGASAQEAKDRYSNDPTTDFHDMVADMCRIDRTPAKEINFGLAYSMGKETLAQKLNRTLAEAEELFQQYHSKLSFVKDLQKATTQVASNRGWLKTILGRKARFPFWEPKNWDEGRNQTPLTEAKARDKWKQIRRAFTHKALNSLIQGSAADIMKKAMSDITKSGVLDVIGAPHLTVHDELDWSVNRSKEHLEAHREVLNIMQTCVKLTVPLVCDTESGPNWGEVK